MYGFIYNTLRGLIILKFNEETWLDICEESGIMELRDGILDRHYYNESYLVTIGMTASRKLDLPLETILEWFGGFFFVTCKKSGHSGMLRTLGHNLYGFLMNLDSLHDHLSVTYTQMAAPSFRCEKTRSSITLHYYSQRPGLSTIVLGIVKAVADDFFNLDINIRQTLYETTAEKLAHHYVFLIECADSPKNAGNYLERLTGDLNVTSVFGMLQGDDKQETKNVEILADCPFNFAPNLSDGYIAGDPLSVSVSMGNRSRNTGHVTLQARGSPDTADTITEVGSSRITLPDDTSEVLKQQLSKSITNSSLDMPSSQLPHFSMSRIQSRRGSVYPGEITHWPINPSLFQTCFPFHIIFDKDLIILYMGISFTRIFPKAVSSMAMLSDYFVLTRPAISLTYANICTSIHNIFIMSAKKSSCKNAPMDLVPFRGQMIPTCSREGADILFLGSPRVNSIEELEYQGLYLSDIPVHDVTRDLILLNQHFHVERNTAALLQEMKRDLEVQKANVEHEKHRADMLLHSMLPLSVANELKTGAQSTAMDYESVTILFSDIKGFTTICNSCDPFQVVGMLNSLYTLFDHKLEHHNVYKVETIGDAYMVAAGLLDTADDHAVAVTNMAFSMREEAGKVMEPVNKIPLQIRIGIHTGPVVAGVVGKKMPRYCLFGDTVNTASRMESNSKPGKINLSGEAYNEIKDKRYRFFSRELIDVKGLGERQTYFVEPLGEGEEPGTIPSPKISVSSKKSVGVESMDLTPCIVTLPPISNHPQNVSSFPVETPQEEDRNTPVYHAKIMDSMVKPHPSEQAWVQNRKKHDVPPEPIPADIVSTISSINKTHEARHSTVTENHLIEIRTSSRRKLKCTII